MTDPKQRKVLFISADQWRGDCLSAVGHPCLRTPHLDRLAAEGTLFRRHYAQASPCGPSRASLLTGLYLMNHRSGRNGTPLDRRHTNIALETRKAGYDPTLFGYTDSSADPRDYPPDDPALRTYEGVLPGMTVGLQLPDHMQPWIADLKAKGYRFEGRKDVFRPRDGGTPPPGRGFSFTPPIFSSADSETAFMANAFLDWLDKRGGEPWFAHLVFLRPHPPLIAPEPYNARYDPAAVPMAHRAVSAEAEAGQHPFLRMMLDALRQRGVYNEHYPYDLTAIDEAELRQLRATYFGMINQVDDQIGRILAYLKESGQAEDTLVIFTCDHGEMLGDHWMWGKSGYFDQAYHIPLIVRDPRRRAAGGRGRQVDAFTESVDIMPTILEWLGLEVPQQCDGRSLMRFLEGGTPQGWRRDAHWEFDFRDIEHGAAEAALGLRSDQCSLAVLRDDAYKYVHFTGLPPLLFDMRRDPFEAANLAADRAYAPVLLDYAQRMLSWRMEHAEHVLSRMHLTPQGVKELPRAEP